MKIMQIYKDGNDIRVDIDDKFYVIQTSMTGRYVIEEMDLPCYDRSLIATADTIGECFEFLYHTQLRE